MVKIWNRRDETSVRSRKVLVSIISTTYLDTLVARNHARVAPQSLPAGFQSTVKFKLLAKSCRRLVKPKSTTLRAHVGNAIPLSILGYRSISGTGMAISIAGMPAWLS